MAIFKPGFIAMAALTMPLLIPSAASAAQLRDVTGIWMTDDGQGAVEISAAAINAAAASSG